MKISLRAKLSVFSSLLVLSVVTGVGAGLYVAEKKYLRERLEADQVQALETLNAVAREALSQKNALLLSRYLNLIGQSRDLTYALVTDRAGKILAHNDVVLVGQRAADPATENALKASQFLRQETADGDDRVIDLSLPLYIEGVLMGSARVGYSDRRMNERVDQALLAARQRISLTGIFALLGGMLGSLFMAHYLTRPISQLREGAKKIGEGDLKHRLAIISQDELSDLAREFNLMAEKLQELDSLKQDFVSNVTHELRSPLTSLRGYVDFILKGDCGPLTEEQRENLIIIKNNAGRLAKFIDMLLDVAKIESKKMELHPEPVSIDGLAREMAVLFRPQAEEKKLEFSQDIPLGLPPAWADADALSEILTNLLSNAMKFTPENGRVTLAAKLEKEEIIVSVADTGVGIPADSLGKVFDKFEQVKPTEGLARRTKGTGLGLTIVKGFVEAHGGRVWIESEERKGTRIYFTLPLAEAA